MTVKKIKRLLRRNPSRRKKRSQMFENQMEMIVVWKIYLQYNTPECLQKKPLEKFWPTD